MDNTTMPTSEYSDVYKATTAAVIFLVFFVPMTYIYFKLFYKSSPKNPILPLTMSPKIQHQNNPNLKLRVRTPLLI